MQSAVSRHMQGMASMDRLLGMVQHIQRGSPLPASTADEELYVVELLDLSIWQ